MVVATARANGEEKTRVPSDRNVACDLQRDVAPALLWLANPPPRAKIKRNLVNKQLCFQRTRGGDRENGFRGATCNALLELSCALMRLRARSQRICAHACVCVSVAHAPHIFTCMFHVYTHVCSSPCLSVRPFFLASRHKCSWLSARVAESAF